MSAGSENSLTSNVLEKSNMDSYQAWVASFDRWFKIFFSNKNIHNFMVLIYKSVIHAWIYSHIFYFILIFFPLDTERTFTFLP
jgi:hypothetical protein